MDLSKLPINFPEPVDLFKAAGFIRRCAVICYKLNVEMSNAVCGFVFINSMLIFQAMH